LGWLRDLKPPKAIFLVHGEVESAEAFAGLLKAERGWSVHMPALGETRRLE
jgi:Cft2 family RNA processing exonuclease